ncbi:hypothetical protein ABC733_00615 [Mangrovibacter sp. SLW1]
MAQTPPLTGTVPADAVECPADLSLLTREELAALPEQCQLPEEDTPAQASGSELPGWMTDQTTLLAGAVPPPWPRPLPLWRAVAVVRVAVAETVTMVVMEATTINGKLATSWTGITRKIPWKVTPAPGKGNRQPGHRQQHRQHPGRQHGRHRRR